MKPFKITALLSLIAVLSGCMTPKSFVQTNEASWGSVELRRDVAKEVAWESVVDILVKRFDLEVLSKENGYIRTNWLYTWASNTPGRYRVRVIIKFSPAGDKVDIKSDAEFDSGTGWVQGTDTRLLSTIKGDIMGTVGRTTR